MTVIIKSEEFFKKYKTPEKMQDLKPEEVSEFLKKEVYNGHDQVAITQADREAYEQGNEDASKKVAAFIDQGQRLIKYMVEEQKIINFGQLNEKFNPNVPFAENVAVIQGIKETMEAITYRCANGLSDNARSHLSDRTFACGPGTLTNLQEILQNLSSLSLDLNGIIGLQKAEWIGQIFLEGHTFGAEDAATHREGMEVHRKKSLQNLVAEFYDLPVKPVSEDPYMWSDAEAIRNTGSSNIQEAKEKVRTYVESELQKENALGAFIGTLINSGYASLPEFTKAHKDMEERRVNGVLPKERTQSFGEAFDEFQKKLGIEDLELGLHMFAHMKNYSYTGYRVNASSVLEDAIILRLYKDGVVNIDGLDLAKLESRLLLSRMEMDGDEYALSVDNVNEAKEKLKKAGLTAAAADEYIWDFIVRSDVKLLGDEFDGITSPLQYMKKQGISLQKSLVEFIYRTKGLDDVIAINGPEGVFNLLIKHNNTKALDEYRDFSESEKAILLDYAVQKQSIDLIIKSIEIGADINAKDKDGKTPLHIAVSGYSTGVLNTLLEKGADINAKDKDGKTPLHIAVSGYSTGVLNTLLEKGADINAKDKDGKTPLHIAVSGYSTGVLNTLLEKGADINAKDKDGKTPLHIAVSGYSTGVLNTLLEKGADINAKDKDGKTPLRLATENGQPHILTAWGEYSTRTDLSNEQQIQFFNAALETSNTIILENLIRTYPGLANIEHQGEGLLQLFYNLPIPPTDIIITLINAGANLDYISQRAGNNGLLPILHWAIAERKIDVIKAVLASDKVDVNIQDNNGDTALHLAIEKEYIDVIEALLASDKVDVNIQGNNGYTALHLAVEKEYIDVIEALLASDKVDVNVENNYNDTALHIAAFNGNINSVKALLASDKVDVNIKHLEDGATPLNIAISYNKLDIAEALMNKGADPNIADNYGFTPLHQAAISGKENIVEALINKGADPNIKDTQGRKAIHVTESKIVKELLAQHTTVTTGDVLHDKSMLLASTHINQNPIQSTAFAYMTCTAASLFVDVNIPVISNLNSFIKASLLKLREVASNIGR